VFCHGLSGRFAVGESPDSRSKHSNVFAVMHEPQRDPANSGSRCVKRHAATGRAVSISPPCCGLCSGRTFAYGCSNQSVYSTGWSFTEPSWRLFSRMCVQTEILGPAIPSAGRQRLFSPDVPSSRSCFFFLLVRQILGTYNSGSAYVRLEDWQGADCHDCGRLMHEDDRGTCERCECDICNNCVTRCTKCDQHCCADCSATCEDCGEPFCSPCLSKCPNCRLLFCEDCLNDGICHACTESEEEENDETPPAEQGFGNDHPTDAPVHSVCVGQAAVPA